MSVSRSAIAASVLLVSLIAKATAQTCPINSVCFVMDRSGSMRGFYDQEQSFVVSISREIATRTRSTLYSAYGFAGSSFLISKSTDDLEGTFIPAVNRPISPGGTTNMYNGLSRCYNELKDQGAGQQEFNRVIVLVTDGQDRGDPTALQIAPTIKNAGISIVTVGIGNDIEQSYLRNVATNEDLFVASSFADLPSNVVNVAESSCRAPSMTPEPMATTTPPATTAAPVAVPTPDTSSVAPTTPSATCTRAYNACGFKFTGHSTPPTVSVTTMADKSMSPVIESRLAGERIGILNTNNVVPEFINRDGSAVNITTMAEPRFTPTHFKPFSMPVPLGMDNGMNLTYYGSGVGHQVFHGTQERLARKRCVRLYFTHYQVLSGGNMPYVTGNINVEKSDNKCVVFLTN